MACKNCIDFPSGWICDVCECTKRTPEELERDVDELVALITCEATNSLGDRCIHVSQHVGPHETYGGDRWLLPSIALPPSRAEGDYAQCPASFNEHRCTRGRAHDGPHAFPLQDNHRDCGESTFQPTGYLRPCILPSGHHGPHMSAHITDIGEDGETRPWQTID